MDASGVEGIKRLPWATLLPPLPMPESRMSGLRGALTNRRVAMGALARLTGLVD